MKQDWSPVVGLNAAEVYFSFSRNKHQPAKYYIYPKMGRTLSLMKSGRYGKLNYFLTKKAASKCHQNKLMRLERFEKDA